MSVALLRRMMRRLSHVIALGALAASVSVVGALSCSHPATDRVLEPSGGPGGGSPASPSSPWLADAGLTPAPLATTPEPDPDYTAIRAPEFGLPAAAHPASLVPTQLPMGGSGGTGGGGAGGGSGGGIFR